MFGIRITSSLICIIMWLPVPPRGLETRNDPRKRYHDLQSRTLFDPWFSNSLFKHKRNILLVFLWFNFKIIAILVVESDVLSGGAVEIKFGGLKGDNKVWLGPHTLIGNE
jgi:hypothetical protein